MEHRPESLGFGSTVRTVILLVGAAVAAALVSELVGFLILTAGDFPTLDWLAPLVVFLALAGLFTFLVVRRRSEEARPRPLLVSAGALAVMAGACWLEAYREQLASPFSSFAGVIPGTIADALLAVAFMCVLGAVYLAWTKRRHA